MTETTLEQAPVAQERRLFAINNPASGTEVARYPLMYREEVDQAIRSARQAFGSWSHSTFAERKRILLKASSFLAENAGNYADEIVAENGKTRTDALIADIFTTTHLMKFYAHHAEKYLKPVRRLPGIIIAPLRRCYYKFEPKGVVGVISPWNYPFTLSAAPVISAVMAGNTVVLKPSSQTTRSGLIVKEVLESGGLPPGVIQVITGMGSVTGQALIEHEGLDMLFFTGSTEVGREVNVRAAEHLIPTILELGGKDVSIVTRKADLDRAAHGIVWGCFTNAGQTCIGTEIILVDKAVYRPFLEKISALTSQLKLGKESGEVGAMTMTAQLEIVQRQLADALAKGATIACTGQGDTQRPGNWFVPTLLTEVSTDMDVFSQETFGPLKPVIPYESLDEAIELANSVEYGLSGSVFTKDMAEGRWIADRLKTGSVNINDVLLTYAIPSLPFGGVKKSGIGNYHSKSGIRSFTDVKSITETKIPLKREVYWYPMWPNTDLMLEGLIALLYARKLTKRLSALLSASKALMGVVFRK